MDLRDIPMQIASTVKALRAALEPVRRSGGRVGFVPTMGFLHDGHFALIRASVERCNATVVSIFVNPTQFGPSEDLGSYPRDMSRDQSLCADAGADVLFVPDARDVYPAGFQTHVEPGELAQPLCGALRPGHFRGVATVVAKLFNMVQPQVAFFGQKDYQQSLVVRRMALDLDMPLEIVTVPTVREPDGLAMSSRNGYLGAAERLRASCISRGLFGAQAAFARGERDAVQLLTTAKEPLLEVDRLQYLELRDAETLAPVIDQVDGAAVLCAAAFIGSVRLIDNVLLTCETGQSA